MKKYINIVAGIIVTLWFFVIEIFIYSPLFEYNEKYAVIQNLMLYILPSASGLITVLFLRRDSVKAFFKAWGIYFLTSFILIIAYEAAGLSKIIHFWFTGYDEFSMGDGLLFAVILINHLKACFVGVIVSGLISLHRQKKNRI